MAKLTDDSLMPFGIHKGKKMLDVPASYLLFLHEGKKYTEDVKDYIIDNLDVINKQVMEEKK